MPAKTEQKKVHPNVAARVLPHSDDAEQAVLGCVLIDEDAPVAIISELKPEDFYEPAHKQIFSAMSALYNRDKPIDYVTLVEELTEAGVIDSVGGMSYIISLTNYVPSAANYRHYLEIVKKTSTLRKLISSSQQIMDIAYSGDAEDKALSFAEGEIYGIAEKQDRGTLIDMNEAVDRAFKIMDEKQADPTAQRTVPIPFTKLNELLGGFHPSDLVLIAARPACGKTSLGMNFISHAALDKSRKTPAGKVDPFKCAVFSLEMSAEQIATRLLCSVAKVSMEHVNSGMRTVQENMRLVEAQRKLSEAKVFIDDSSLTTPIEILSKCRRLKREQGLDLILVDYLQLMSSGKRVESRQQEVSDITRTMKIAAKELNVPILLLSQMSRDIEKRTDKTPQMSDLRESGAIEQDADIIIFLHREHSTTDMTVDEDTRTKCDLIVAKHRNGRTDKVTVRWHGEYTTFTDLYENRRDAEIEARQPSFTDHFTGVDDENVGTYAENPDVPDLPPMDEVEPPAERKGKKPSSDESDEPAPPPENEKENFSFDDDFTLVVKGDDDII